jgi:nitrate reductase gamma subunit
MNVLIALAATVVLAAIAYLVSTAGAQIVFGIIVPYVALVLFLGGVLWRIFTWARVPVPFKIPTTCGQQVSLPWIKSATIESPHTWWGVVARMALEVFFFRSLFRNTRTELHRAMGKGDVSKLAYASNEWLWLFALIFHYSFLLIFLRHFRLFTHPVPEWINGIAYLDGFLQIGVPVLYLTDMGIVVAATFLFVRRLWHPHLRFISLVQDYFPLFLILGVAITGILLRYWVRVDVVYVKELALGLLSFNPPTDADVLGSINAMFFTHLFLVSVLIAYLPFSKLSHMAGVFFSPTRNMTNDNRMRRHVNPWSPKVKFHTYDEWENEFRKKMKAAGLPVDRDEPAQSEKE